MIGLLGIALTFGAVGNAFADAKEELAEASSTLKNFTSMPERQIPPEVLQRAKGFAVFHIVDVALLASGKGGNGVVAARTGNNGWSAPLFVTLGGGGVGAQIGAKVKDVVLVLNSQKAVDALKQGNVKLGANLSTAAGPANASAEAQTLFNSIDIFSYAASEGVFAGASLQGSVLAPNSDMNNNFYGKSVTPKQILSGKCRPRLVPRISSKCSPV